jgi:hypothetical protein
MRLKLRESLKAYDTNVKTSQYDTRSRLDFPYRLDQKQRKTLQHMGYDGVVLAIPGEIPEFVVFDSTQIKSADNNTGAFDGTNSDTRYSLASSASDAIEFGQKAWGEATGSGIIKEILNLINPADFSRGRQWTEQR